MNFDFVQNERRTSQGNVISPILFILCRVELREVPNSLMMESTSGGDIGSWTKRIVNDFPLDKHIVDSGYTLDDIGGVVDPNGPADSLAIESCDGSGGIAIDANAGWISTSLYALCGGRIFS